MSDNTDAINGISHAEVANALQCAYDTALVRMQDARGARGQPNHDQVREDQLDRQFAEICQAKLSFQSVTADDIDSINRAKEWLDNYEEMLSSTN